MERIRTTQGQFTDPEFEAAAVCYFRNPLLHDLPGPVQVNRLLTDHGVSTIDHNWARAVAQRALTKLVLCSSSE